MTKKNSLKNHNQDDLLKIVADKREELRGLRFSASGSKNRNVKLARTLRKDVARAMTELAAQKAAAKK
ncbi:MAG TPA: 50S ribosomal protein L29 [Candidatus Paceibacterota bacterium]|nr:50S ribosomal protein L29 [Candidatus Paceibacterota bacterium]